MRFFKQVSELLEAADEKASTSDLQSLGREVAGGALDAGRALHGGAADRVKRIDLGIVQGMKELTSQIGTDLKDMGTAPPASDGSDLGCSAAAAPSLASSTPTRATDALAAAPSAAAPQAKVNKAAQRLADLREHVRELEAREEERLRARDRLQQRFDETEALCEADALREAEGEAAEGADAEDATGAELAAPERGAHATAVSEDGDARLVAMRREFYEGQAHEDARATALQAEIAAAEGVCARLDAELDFWRGKSHHMLEALGLTEVPEDIRRALEAGVEEEGDDELPIDADEASRRESRAREEREVAERQAAALAVLEEERARQQSELERLERRLESLVRTSDAAAERVDSAHLRERELEAGLAAMQAAAAAGSLAADEAAAAADAAQEARTEAERAHWSSLRRAQEAREAVAAAGDDAHAGCFGLRRKAEALAREAEETRRNNGALEAQLRRHRAAATKDLERAVPLSTASCWRALDAPAMKAVTLLVRSSCLRRAFAVHLLATYVWLFFLIFWLEKH